MFAYAKVSIIKLNTAVLMKIVQNRQGGV